MSKKAIIEVVMLRSLSRGASIRTMKSPKGRLHVEASVGSEKGKGGMCALGAGPSGVGRWATRVGISGLSCSHRLWAGVVETAEEGETKDGGEAGDVPEVGRVALMHDGRAGPWSLATAAEPVVP
jgi:hypothetical protein